MNTVICVYAASTSIMLLLNILLLCMVSGLLKDIHAMLYNDRQDDPHKEPVKKQSIYWTDEDGHRRWRKND